MAAIDLNDEERQALVGLLTTEIEGSRYPLSPRIVMLKGIRAKLRGDEVPPPQTKPRQVT